MKLTVMVPVYNEHMEVFNVQRMLGWGQAPLLTLHVGGRGAGG